ncbi:MAG: dipeptidase [Paracoccaceae bacterium]
MTPVAVFDGHNDTILRLEQWDRIGAPRDLTGPVPEFQIDLPRARLGGFAGGFFAMFAPSDGFRDPRTEPDDAFATAELSEPEALAHTLALFAQLRRLARAHPDQLTICRSATEIHQAMGEGRIAALPHIEGAECIGPDLAALEVLHAAGLRSLGLVWSRTNIFGIGAPMSPATPFDAETGLSDAGRALVAACNALGIVVDLSHLNDGGFWDVARISEHPLVATHSNARALCPSPRNLSDDQLRAIAETGGVVGLNFHVHYLSTECGAGADVPLQTMVRHLEHLLGILGEDGVALGSDFDGCTLPVELADVAGLPRLIEAMRAAGFGEALIAKIARENWLSLLDRTGVAA